MPVSTFMRQFDPLLSKSSTVSTWEGKRGGEWGLKRDPFSPLVSQVMTHFLLVSSIPLSDFATYTHIWLQVYVVRMFRVGRTVGVAFMQHIHLPSAPHFTLLYVLHKNWQYLKSLSLSSSSCILHRRLGTSRTFSHKTAPQKDFFDAFINELHDNLHAKSHTTLYISHALSFRQQTAKFWDMNILVAVVIWYGHNIFLHQNGCSKTSVIAYQITRCHNPKDLPYESSLSCQNKNLNCNNMDLNTVSRCI
jgi:hypothetical protein